MAEELKILSNCLGENTEKYTTFTVPIEKEVTRIDKKGEETTKNISCILLIWNLVNNLSEGIHRIKSKFGHNDKKCVTCGIKYKHFDFFLQYTSFNDY